MSEITRLETRPAGSEPGSGGNFPAPVDLKGLQASIATKAAGEAMKVASKVMAARAVSRDISMITTDLLGYDYTDENGNIVHEPGQCDNLMFAEQAVYAKPVGSGSIAEGPSHWFAKYLASIWGNFDWESIEHTKSQSEQQTQIQVVCWDIEKNSTHSETVIVLHKKAGTDTTAHSADDIRQEVNRQKSILERNCLLDCFPKDLVQRCFERMLETLDKSQAEALKTPQKSLELFAKKLDVEVNRVYAFLKITKPEQLKASHLRRLQSAFKAIQAGEIKKEKLFSASATVNLTAEPPAEEKPKETKKAAKEKEKAKDTPPPPAEDKEQAPPAEPEPPKEEQAPPQPEPAASRSLPAPPVSQSTDLLPEDEF